MTIKQLQKLLKGMPPDMQVVMPAYNDILITVCKEQSEVITIMPDENNPEETTVLLLLPCTCFDQPEPGEINSQPELN